MHEYEFLFTLTHYYLTCYILLYFYYHIIIITIIIVIINIVIIIIIIISVFCTGAIHYTNPLRSTESPHTACVPYEDITVIRNMPNYSGLLYYNYVLA